MSKLAGLKLEIDKLGIGKLKTTLADLSNHSNVAEKQNVKKNVYDKVVTLVKKVSAIQTTDNSNLVEKADYNTEIDEISKKIPNHDKYFTTPDFNKLTSENFAARLKVAKLATKDDIDFVKETDFDGKLINTNRNITSNKARHVKAEKTK